MSAGTTGSASPPPVTSAANPYGSPTTWAAESTDGAIITTY